MAEANDDDTSAQQRAPSRPSVPPSSGESSSPGAPTPHGGPVRRPFVPPAVRPAATPASPHAPAPPRAAERGDARDVERLDLGSGMFRRDEPRGSPELPPESAVVDASAVEFTDELRSRRGEAEEVDLGPDDPASVAAGGGSVPPALGEMMPPRDAGFVTVSRQNGAPAWPFDDFPDARAERPTRPAGPEFREPRELQELKEIEPWAVPTTEASATSGAQAVAEALERTAQRFRSGDLDVRQERAPLTDEEALAVALAALLRASEG